MIVLCIVFLICNLIIIGFYVLIKLKKSNLNKDGFKNDKGFLYN